MNLVSGIYGYQITHAIDLPGLRIEPRFTDYVQSNTLARDLNTYQLTAILIGEEISDKLVFKLEAILSYIEHLDVIITAPKEKINDDPFTQFSASITTHRRNNGGGAVINDDIFFPESRTLFITNTLKSLQDHQYCEQTQFNILFFKCVEAFRQRKPFIEVKYFLLYSGLESYARAVVNDRDNRNSSVPIYNLLIKYGFDVYIERPNDLHRAISTYTHLRNALFHNSALKATVNINGKLTLLSMYDYLFNFSHLVSLVILKAINFDDGHINWDSWIDRKHFM